MQGVTIQYREWQGAAKQGRARQCGAWQDNTGWGRQGVARQCRAGNTMQDRMGQGNVRQDNAWWSQVSQGDRRQLRAKPDQGTFILELKCQMHISELRIPD